jgi:hypothetical protein
VVAVVALLALFVHAARAADGLPELWIEDVAEPVKISDEDAEALTRFVAGRVMRAGDPRRTLPAGLAGDRSPRIVLLSVSDGRGPARVVLGTGRGIGGAAGKAVDQALAWQDYTPKWVKLDVVQRTTAVGQWAVVQGLSLDRSLCGLAFDRRTRLAFLPEELVADTLVDSEGRIRFDRIAERLKRDPARKACTMPVVGDPEFRMFRFSAESFFWDGVAFHRLYRGHRRLDTVRTDELLSAARAGGDYLTRNVAKDGRFVYAYRPKSDRELDDYNILRHAGTTYSMLELHAVCEDVALLAAVRRSLTYLLRHVQPSLRHEQAACIVEDGFVKLGGNALAVLALAKYTEVTGDRRHLPVMRRLARWIKNQQAPSGRFAAHKVSYPDGKDQGFVSQYYPGEALLAMMRMHALEPKAGYLDVAAKGARWLITVRDRDVPVAKLLHDHWLLYALNELYRAQGDELYLEHAVRIGTAIAQKQNRRPEYPDWLGSYYRPPRSTPTATRTEGLIAAYELCRDFGHKEAASVFLDAARLGIRFQLQTQFGPESVLYLTDPQRCLGAFHRSLTNYEIRIDYVQHNISALLAMRRLLKEQKRTGQ